MLSTCAERMLKALEATDCKSTCHELVEFPSSQVSFYVSCLSASTNTHTHAPAPDKLVLHCALTGSQVC